MRTQAQVSISVTLGGDLNTMPAEVFCTGDTTFHILSPVTQIRRLLSLLWYAECARGGCGMVGGSLPHPLKQLWFLTRGGNIVRTLRQGKRQHEIGFGVE